VNFDTLFDNRTNGNEVLDVQETKLMIIEADIHNSLKPKLNCGENREDSVLQKDQPVGKDNNNSPNGVEDRNLSYQRSPSSVRSLISLERSSAVAQKKIIALKIQSKDECIEEAMQYEDQNLSTSPQFEVVNSPKRDTPEVTPIALRSGPQIVKNSNRRHQEDNLAVIFIHIYCNCEDGAKKTFDGFELS